MCVCVIQQRQQQLQLYIDGVDSIAMLHKSSTSDALTMNSIRHPAQMQQRQPAEVATHRVIIRLRMCAVFVHVRLVNRSLNAMLATQIASALCIRYSAIIEHTLFRCVERSISENTFRTTLSTETWHNHPTSHIKRKTYVHVHTDRSRVHSHSMSTIHPQLSPQTGAPERTSWTISCHYRRYLFPF